MLSFAQVYFLQRAPENRSIGNPANKPVWWLPMLRFTGALSKPKSIDASTIFRVGDYAGIPYLQAWRTVGRVGVG